MANEVSITVSGEDNTGSATRSAVNNMNQIGESADRAASTAGSRLSALGDRTDNLASKAGTATGSFGALVSGVDLMNSASERRIALLDVESTKSSARVGQIDQEVGKLEAELAASGGSNKAIEGRIAALNQEKAALSEAQVARDTEIAQLEEEVVQNQKYETALMAVAFATDAFSGVTDLATLALKTSIFSKTKDIAVTVAKSAAEKAAAVGTKAWAAAQWLMNAALTANPIGLVIIAIAALVAGIIIAYKKSETFRNIVQGAFRGVQAAGKFLWQAIQTYFRAIGTVFRWVVDRGKDLVSRIKDSFSKIGSAAKVVGNAISAPFRVAFNAVRNFWNSTVGGKGFTIPGWVPFVGGKEFRFPYFATGGIAPGGFAGLNERGIEMVRLPSGSRVIPHNTTQNMVGGATQIEVIIKPAPGSDRGLMREIINGLAIEVKSNGVKPSTIGLTS